MARFRGMDEETVNQTLDFSYLRLLWPFVRPYRRAFLACVIMLVLSFLVELAGPYLIRLIIDGPAGDALTEGSEDYSRVWWLGLGLFGSTFAGIFLGYHYTMLTAKNGQRVIRDLRLRLFDHLLRLGPSFYDKNPSGRLVTRITSDVENLNELISTGVLQTLFDLLRIFGILGALFLIDLRLALYTLLVTPLVLGVSLLFRKYARAAYRRVRGCLGRLNAFFSEMIGGMRTVRAFGQEAAVLGHFSKLNRETQGAWRQTVLHFALFFAIVDLVLRWSNAGLLLVGGTGILAGTITIGIFVQFYLYFGKLTEPIKALGEKYNVLQSAFASCERIFKILGETPMPLEVDAPIESQPGPAKLEFRAVDFEYLPNTPILTGIDFQVEPGSTCAIVGPTGAGKSTILSLVSRMYDPSSGQVLLNGDSLHELSLRSLRRRIAVVQQDVFLFSGTVLDNVRLLDPSITEERVRAALEMVGALEFVAALPGGLQAEVEERGAKFSQGERQLLSFARALAADPDILLLDEATANVDSDSEARIQRALGQVISGRTCLVVAHRLSTVRHADQILVMQAGQIAERGRHDELLAQSGIYAGMIKGLG